ncbi:MAG: hypothetical protein FWG45_07900 [Oscillospiraceae bacterium]|nr:hypothetical protein [Oscillospiraceae bacterium]
MSFYELLCKFTFEELWYILSMRHDMQRKPFRAQQCFNSYKSAYEELLSLHADDNPKENILVCEMVIDRFDNGAPNSSIHCNMLSPNEDENENGELKSYGMDFVPWIELIDVPVSEESIAKYGELICAAELLWEITFHGYTAERVDDESDRLREIVENPGEMVEWNPDDFKWCTPEKEKERERAVAQWFADAPEAVKQIIFDMISADVTHRDEDDITLDETLKRLRKILENSALERENSTNGVLYAMLEELDTDEHYLLLNAVNGLTP